MIQPVLEVARRLDSFAETMGGLSEKEVLAEARRCFSCGNCFECDTCRDICPDQAIYKLGKGNRYEINLEQCSGCGLCAQECPCGAIDMKAQNAF